MTFNNCYVGHSTARDQMYSRLQEMISKNIFSNKKVYMFGTSKIASMIISYLDNNGVKLTGIIDNDPSKQGFSIAGFNVVSPETIKSFDENIIILIASSYQEEMVKQLKNFGYSLETNIIKVIDLPLLMNDYSFIDRTNYKVMPEKEIRKRQVDIIKYLKYVCDENGIDYYLAYGTLLGAVRHGGFIPWDDDVDIYIKGKDIDKLAELVNQSDRFAFITCKNCNNYFDQISLMIDKNSVIDFNCFPLQATTGIFIDIFPLYGLPSEEVELKEYVEVLKQLEMDKWNCLYDENKCHEAALKINDFISSYDYEKYDSTGFFLSPYFTKDYLPKEFFSTKQYLLYEGEKLCVPGNYSGILKQIYGDYKVLPPENKRGGRHYYKAYYPHNDISQNSINKEYWNKFYNGTLKLDYPSNFARDITNYLKPNTVLVDLGCGNGRDSLYFDNIGLNVIAIDMSETATNKLKEEHKDKKIQFCKGDFVRDWKLYNCNPDYFYSRFTIHAITEKQQNELISNVYRELKIGGKFFIEVRCVLDDIYGLGEEIDRNTYIYEGHYRRFIERVELEEELVKQGFSIEYSEENKNFAPFKDRNPIILRIIAEKK